jgi:cell wall-associated NlpC family hydrolase
VNHSIQRQKHKSPPAAPAYADAHSFITWIFWTAFGKRVDHLNGQAWQTVTIAGTAARGTQVSRSEYLLALITKPASTAAARPGDLIFFGASPSVLSHVAMYMGSNKVLTFGDFNFPGKAAVKIEDLSYRKDIVQIRSYPLFLI